MNFFKYLASIIRNRTGNSSKSFTLVASTIVSFIAGIGMTAVICYDGFSDGVIDTDLEKSGIFMLCMGGFMATSGVPKIFGEKYYKENDRIGDDDEIADEE